VTYLSLAIQEQSA
jgi:hypothetical protein